MAQRAGPSRLAQVILNMKLRFLDMKNDTARIWVAMAAITLNGITLSFSERHFEENFILISAISISVFTALVVLINRRMKK